MAFTSEEAKEFVALLHQFTDDGRAEWLAPHAEEPQYVYCFVEGERIDFVAYRDGDDPVSVWSSDIAAIGGRWRHHELLFLAPEEMYPALLPLLRTAAPDLRRWQGLTRQATRNALDALHHAREKA